MEKLTIKSLFELYKPKEDDLLISDKLVFALCSTWNTEFVHPVIEALALPNSSEVNAMMIEYISTKTKMGLSNPQVDFKRLIGNNKIVFCRYSGYFNGVSFRCPVVSFAFGDKRVNTYPYFFERTIVHEYTHKATFFPRNALLDFIAEGIAASAETEYLSNQYKSTKATFANHYLQAYKFIDGVCTNYVGITTYNRNIIRGNESQLLNGIREIINNREPDLDVDAYLSLNGLLFHMCEYKRNRDCYILHENVSDFNAKLFDKSRVITLEDKMKIRSSLAFTKILNCFIEQLPNEIMGAFTRSLASYLCKSTIGNGICATSLLFLDNKDITLQFLTAVKNIVESSLKTEKSNNGIPIENEELSFWEQTLGLQADTKDKGHSLR